jgi:hypothetical protein
MAHSTSVSTLPYSDQPSPRRAHLLAMGRVGRVRPCASAHAHLCACRLCLRPAGCRGGAAHAGGPLLHARRLCIARRLCVHGRRRIARLQCGRMRRHSMRGVPRRRWRQRWRRCRAAAAQRRFSRCHALLIVPVLSRVRVKQEPAGGTPGGDKETANCLEGVPSSTRLASALQQ